MSGQEAKKVSDFSLEEFVEIVKKADPELAEKAENEAKVNIAEAVRKVKEGVVSNFSIRTGVTKAISELRNAVELALAKTTEVFFLGMRDKPGSTRPSTALLMRLQDSDSANGKKATIFEASTFDPQFELPDGKKVKLDHPAKITIKVKENTKFKSIEIVQLLKYEFVSAEKIAATLIKQVQSPNSYTSEDKYAPIVLLGTIRGIYPINTLVKTTEDKWEVSGTHPIMVLNQIEEDARENKKPALTPVCKIKLDPIGGVSVNVSIEPRRYTEPIVEILDFMDAARASLRDIKTPKEQASEVGGLFENRDVIVAGIVTNVKAGANATYMEVSASCILDAPSNVDWFGTTEKKTETEPAQKAAAPAAADTTEEPKSKPKTKKAKPAPEPAATPATESAPAKPETTETNSGVKPVTRFEEVKAAISEYCSKLGLTPAQLTVDLVQAQVCQAAKPGIIEAAIEELKESKA